MMSRKVAVTIGDIQGIGWNLNQIMEEKEISNLLIKILIN